MLRGKTNYRRKRSSSRRQQTRSCYRCSLITGALFISTLCHKGQPSTRNITLKSWRYSGSMLTINACNWWIGESSTRIIVPPPLLHEWCKNTSKTPMLNYHLIHYTCQISLVWFLAVSGLNKHLPGCQLARNNEVINKLHTFFNSLP